MLTCSSCGVEYPGELPLCPRCGSATDLRRGSPPAFLPLRGLGNVLIIVLAAVVTAIAVRLVIQGSGLGSAHWRRDFIDDRLGKAADVTMFGLGIGFAVWLRRARINAEHRGWRQRRARGWTFWGWILPVVSLWIPFQIMGDIWRAGIPARQRHKIAWLPALWWATWLLSGVTVGRAGTSPQDYPWLHLSGDIWPGSLGFLAVSGVMLMALIRVISSGPVGSPHPYPPAALPAA